MATKLAESHLHLGTEVWETEKVVSLDKYRESYFLTGSDFASIVEEPKLIEVNTISEANGDAKTPSRRAKKAAMNDSVSRDELAARLEALEARTDTKFERLFGEVREARAQATSDVALLTAGVRGDIETLNATISGKLEIASAKTAGKWTVWTAAGAVIAAMVATIIVLMQVAQTGYDTGRDRERANREEIVRALATAGLPAKAADQAR
jgi:hypothetical protein